MYYARDKRNDSYYEVTSFRDPVTKKPKSSRVCIGKQLIDGTFLPNKFYIEREAKRKLEIELEATKEELSSTTRKSTVLEKSIKTVSGKKKSGLTYSLAEMAKSENLESSLTKVFSKDKARMILSVCFYIISSNSAALDDFNYFDTTSTHPYNKNISSCSSSRLLSSITEQDINDFFKYLRDSNAPSKKEDCFCAFDGTTFSSYSDKLSEVEVSKGKQNPDLKHFALASIYSSHEARCAYYRLYRGNIPDIKTIDNFVEVAKSMNYHFRRIIVDRGYCSYNNLYKLHVQLGYEVIMCMKANLKDCNSALDTVINTFENDSTYFLSEHGVYAKSVEKNIVFAKSTGYNNEVKCYFHVYYNEEKHDKLNKKLHGDVDDSIEKINKLLASGTKTIEEIKDPSYTCKRKNLINFKNLTTLNNMVTKDDVAINKAKKKFGYFFLLTTKKISAKEALDKYRAKDGVERVFRNVKTDLGFKRAYVKNDQTLQGKVFVVMLAGMLSTSIRNKLRDNKDLLTKKLTYNKLLKELEMIYTYEVKGKLKWCEISHLQKSIIKCLDVPEIKEISIKAKSRKGKEVSK